MKRHRTWATVMFADVAGFSTAIIRHGQSAVADLLACRAIFSREVSANGGQLVDTAGDSILAWFSRQDNCLDSLIATFSEIATRGHGKRNAVHLRFRVGVSSGYILAKDGEVFGGAVIEAARICGLCTPGEVAISRPDLDSLRPSFAALPWKR